MAKMKLVSYTIDVEGDSVVLSGNGPTLTGHGLEASFSLDPDFDGDGVDISVSSDIVVDGDPVEVSTTFHLDATETRLLKEYLDELA